MFKKILSRKITTHKRINYLPHIDPKKNPITVEPIVNHINFETTDKILGYRDLVQMDA